MNCTHCNNTGSLSKDAHGYLDCAYCDVAQERADFEAQAKKASPREREVLDLWWAWLRSQAAAAA